MTFNLIYFYIFYHHRCCSLYRLGIKAAPAGKGQAVFQTSLTATRPLHLGGAHYGELKLLSNHLFLHWPQEKTKWCERKDVSQPVTEEDWQWRTLNPQLIRPKPVLNHTTILPFFWGTAAPVPQLVLNRTTFAALGQHCLPPLNPRSAVPRQPHPPLIRVCLKAQACRLRAGVMDSLESTLSVPCAYRENTGVQRRRRSCSH